MASTTPPVGRWGGVQRRVRLLVPRPIRRADLAAFRLVARTRMPRMDPAMSRLTRAANHSRLWMAIAVLLATFGRRFGKRAAVRGLASIAITSAVTNLPAKLLAGRARPDTAVVPEVRRLARVPTSTSFPSGHAASAFAFATAAALEHRQSRAPLFALATAVAYSRVHTGVHYPGDVLVGAAIGAGVAQATTRTWPLVRPRPAATADLDEQVPTPDPDGTGLVVVVNPRAGERPVGPLLERLRTELPSAVLVEAEPDADLVTVLRRAAADARALGVVGGDGTASAGAAVASEFGVPLLVVPGGSMNHLAGDLGIDTLIESVRAVRERRVVQMDLGDVGGRVFVNSVSLGLYARLVAGRERIEDRTGKWPAAVWSLVITLLRGGPVPLEVDGVHRRVWLLFVGNGQYATAGVAPSGRARLGDGCLDVRLVHDGMPWARLRVALALLRNRIDRCRTYERWTASELRVRSPDGPVLVARDGEVEDCPRDVAVHVRRRALLVLQPDTR